MAAEGFVFLPLGLLEREVRGVGGPAGRRVHHRGIETEGEEVVREIIVLADVAARDRARVGPQEVADAAEADGNLPLDIDPKLAWALKFRASFPVDVNRAPRELLLRVPGLGAKAVARILAVRRHRSLRLDDVARLTASITKVRPFICTVDWRPTLLTDRADLRGLLAPRPEQLELFG